MGEKLTHALERVDQLKAERDQAVEEARIWKAHIQSLLQKMEVLTPLFSLLEEARGVYQLL